MLGFEMVDKDNCIFIPGLNIQAPWSQMIIDGLKTIETRSYPLPKKYIDKPFAVISTPGPNKLIPKAEIIGVVVFSECFKYASKTEWLKDFKRHQVKKENVQFSFCDNRPKYAWVVSKIIKIKPSLPPPSRRGIIFASNCKVKDFTF